MLKIKMSLGLICLAVSSAFAQADSLSAGSAGQKHFHFTQAAAFVAPAVLLGYGITAQEYKAFKRVDLNVRADLTEDYPGFVSHVDDRLQYMPVVSVYALGLAGIKGKNDLLDKTALFFISNTIMSASVDFIKTQSHKLRPDGSDFRAFPSGHTATAFSAAEFMAQEYKGVSPWYAVAGYSMAATTGALRMLNNKHWFSDVVTGAGVGILSTKAAYFIYPKIKKMVFGSKAAGFAMMPSYQDHAWGCGLVYRSR
ncbi:MAG: phosphoesterase PA-phosphatase related [Sphingobacteriaceae bacterium]|jgi:hypothetical protein|nr:phosphoesterase PA-phosphatase related [Sphingobacteriaceae bacterium]